MFLVLFTLFVGFLILWHIYKYQTHWRLVNEFPGPRTLPIIGNAHNFGTDPVANHTKFFELWQQYGKDKFRAWIGYNPFIIITNAKDVEFVLNSNSILKKSTVYDLLYDWLGEGLLTSSGTKWFKHRKMITPAFHFKILKDFHDVMKKNSRKFVKKLAEKSENEKIFDFQDMVHYSTLDVICETAMGTEINAMDNQNCELVKAFQDMCYVIQRRSFNPFKANPILYKFSEECRIEKNALNILETFTMDVIEKRRLLLEKNIANSNTETNQSGNKDESFDGLGYTKQKQAFLDTLLMSTIDGKPLTVKEVYEEVSTFMFEGHDTTTSGITFTTYLLSKNPDVQKKVYDEQLTLFAGQNLKDVDPSYQEVLDMKYLDLVIKESLRMYPSVPIIARHTTEPTYLDGKLVPTDTTITVYIFGMGYNEKNFPDPYKFNPDRFEDRETSNPFDYVPFSAGPRNCIGQKFAQLEMKSIISEIVRNFEILPATDDMLKDNGYEKFSGSKYDPVFASLLTLKSDNGVHIRFRPRK